jgi:flagellar assembly factor FliW
VKSIQTPNFGTVKYQENEIVSFPEGLPGFTKLSDFILLQNDETGPFTWLQSIENEAVSFVLADPKKFCADYEAVIGLEELKSIKLEDSKDAALYAMVTLASHKDDVSMNLKAPVIINKAHKLGAQVILRNSNYDIEFKMFAPQRKRDSLGNRRKVKYEVTV